MRVFNEEVHKRNAAIIVILDPQEARKMVEMFEEALRTDRCKVSWKSIAEEFSAKVDCS